MNRVFADAFYFFAVLNPNDLRLKSEPVAAENQSRGPVRAGAIIPLAASRGLGDLVK